jgi:S-formylglutathione hydrolase FrmB
MMSVMTERAAWSETLGEGIRYRVHLTPGREDPRPTLYLLHGRGGSLEDWGEAMPALDAMVERGVVAPLLVVMPDAPWSDRASWYVDSAYAGEPAGREVETAFTTDLVAHVDASYATVADREHRFVGGFSMGGAGALRHLLARPDLFSGGLALSPASFETEPWPGSSTREFGAFGRGQERFDPEVYERLGYVGQLAAFSGSGPVRLFVAAGDEEDLALQAAQVHDRAKRTAGVTSRLRILGGDHDFGVWTPAFVEGLPFVLGADR